MKEKKYNQFKVIKISTQNFLNSTTNTFIYSKLKEMIIKIKLKNTKLKKMMI